jgi:aspartate/tyrosine/aromatic aminotransferase
VTVSATNISDDAFVAEALRRLDLSDSRGAPIIYLHPNEDSAPTGVLVTAEHWLKILDLVPEDESITSLVMAHDHLEGSALGSKGQ